MSLSRLRVLKVALALEFQLVQRVTSLLSPSTDRIISEACSILLQNPLLYLVHHPVLVARIVSLSLQV